MQNIKVTICKEREIQNLEDLHHMLLSFTKEWEINKTILSRNTVAFQKENVNGLYFYSVEKL